MSGPPHLIVGFSNLTADTQKKVLDLYRDLFEKNGKEAHVVLFLNNKKKSFQSFIFNYKTCFKETKVNNSEIKNEENYKANFHKIRGRRN